MRAIIRQNTIPRMCRHEFQIECRRLEKIGGRRRESFVDPHIRTSCSVLVSRMTGVRRCASKLWGPGLAPHPCPAPLAMLSTAMLHERCPTGPRDEHNEQMHEATRLSPERLHADGPTSRCCTVLIRVCGVPPGTRASVPVRAPPPAPVRWVGAQQGVSPAHGLRMHSAMGCAGISEKQAESEKAKTPSSLLSHSM